MTSLFFPNLSHLKIALVPGIAEEFISKSSTSPSKDMILKRNQAKNIIELRRNICQPVVFTVVSGVFAAVGTNNSIIANKACIALAFLGIGLTFKAIQQVYKETSQFLKKTK